LLETTRAYALEKLAESGETEQVARRSAKFFRDTVPPAMHGSQVLPAVEGMTRYGRDNYFPIGASDAASRLQAGVFAYGAGTSHTRAAYHTAQATTNSAITHTHTGIDERASAPRGSNGSSV
jgi:hypothetical protein